MTKDQIKATQERVGTVPDGFWGPKSIAACKKYIMNLMPLTIPWPSSDEASLRKFYGEAGDESKLVNLDVKGFGILYDGTDVRTIRIHEQLSESLGRIIRELSIHHPEVLADYNGSYNFRKMRGGSRYSLHARGAAIDFMAGKNGNHQHWPISASMPITVMEIFAKEGWLPAGVFWGRDAMHFQATK